MTADMVEALKDAAEIPENLTACLDGAHSDGEEYLIELDDDESMAMTELCEWYIQKDRETGQLTRQGQLFDSIIEAISDADA